jgi:hypothetical protein
MVDYIDSAGLSQKACDKLRTAGQVWMQHFDRNPTTNTRVDGFTNDSHTALTQNADDAIGADFTTDYGTDGLHAYDVQQELCQRGIREDLQELQCLRESWQSLKSGL